MKQTERVKNNDVWEKIWSQDFTHRENRIDIEREMRSVRWRKIRNTVLKKFGSFSNLKVIEIGSGRGIYALFTSLEGAQVTLLDKNRSALDKARELFEEWDQDFDAICADAFSLAPDLVGTFDIAMSYGFAEHFHYPERLQIFESHFKLLKPGGLLIVSVPNRAFLPYRLGKFLLEVLNKWELGLEIPFSRGELRNIVKVLSLSNWQIRGSGFLSDTLNFWFMQRLFHLPFYLWDRLRWLLQHDKKNSPLPLKDRFRYFECDREAVVDDYLGYALVLFGETWK